MRYLMIKNKVESKIRDFFKNEDGIGTVEMILILVVLIALVMIFKTQLTSLVNTIFQKITASAGEI